MEDGCGVINPLMSLETYLDKAVGSFNPFITIWNYFKDESPNCYAA